jgi:hypothetical protein
LIIKIGWAQGNNKSLNNWHFGKQIRDSE